MSNFIYMVNDTKKEIFAVPDNSGYEEDDSEELKNMDPDSRLFIRSFQISFNKFKENDWDYSIHDIKRFTEINLSDYQTRGYVLK